MAGSGVALAVRARRKPLEAPSRFSRVTSDGPKKSYEIIQSALAKIPAAEGTLALSDIGVTDPNHPLIALLRVAVGTGPTIGSIRFTKNVINGHFIEDAYIYRVSDTAPTGQAA